MTSNFKQHMIDEAYTPSVDHNAWVAYLVLLERYPKLTYWSYDGYHVHALADYSKDIVWLDNKIILWSTKEELHTVPDFYTAPTHVITNTWTKVVNLLRNKS